MNTRRAAGILLYALADGEPRFLMLRSADHGTWAPPKGHAEPGESALETALRETAEETGIRDPEMLDGFRRDVEYKVEGTGGAHRKVVTWFLARVGKAEHRQSAEHDKSAWMSLEEAVAHAQFDDTRRLLRDADAFLRG